MSFLQPWMLLAIPLMALPIIIHLINQRRYQTRQWGAMMFLIAANRMNRGFAKLRQWLVLTLRALAVGGLIFAVARPLASGLLGVGGGGSVDTTILIIDRSPSMQQLGNNGESKLASALRQTKSALQTIGSDKWVGVTAAGDRARSYPSLDAMFAAPQLRPQAASADVPEMLRRAWEYIEANRPGPTEIWICSDLQRTDWQITGGEWSRIRERFSQLPQSVRFHLVAYPEPSSRNRAVRVTQAEVRQPPASEAAETQVQAGENQLILSLVIDRPNRGRSMVELGEADLGEADLGETDLGGESEGSSAVSNTIPVTIEIEGLRSEIEVDWDGSRSEVRGHRLALPPGMASGWGRVSIPADANNADNDFYFVFSDAPDRKVVVVGERSSQLRPVSIAASLSPDGTGETEVVVLTPEQLDSSSLENAALLIWQAALPDQAIAKSVRKYVLRGGQVLFFAPAGSDLQASDWQRSFMGVRWGNMALLDESAPADERPAAGKPPEGAQSNGEKSVTPVGDTRPDIVSWRSDQGLLAATGSGAGLPLGQLRIDQYCTLEGELVELASLRSGDPFLAQRPTDEGGVYFCTTNLARESSNLAQNGIVLFVMLQRAIAKGQQSLRTSTQRVASTQTSWTMAVESDAFSEASQRNGPSVNKGGSSWERLAGSADVLSTQYPASAGVYRDQDQLFAVNRSRVEDIAETLEISQIETSFAGLPLAVVSTEADDLGEIVREIWRWFLVLMVAALLFEAFLCLPKFNQFGKVGSGDEVGHTTTPGPRAPATEAGAALTGNAWGRS